MSNAFKNLTSLDKRSVEERRKIAAQGGVAKGKATRQKKKLKELIAISGDEKIMTKELIEICKKMGLDDDVTFNIATVRSLRLEAIKGNINAIKMILDNDEQITQKSEEDSHNSLLNAIKGAVRDDN